MAIEEIYKDIAKKAVVANEIGPSGWTKPLPLRANKRFLHNTIKNAVRYNSKKSYDEKEKSRQKLIESYKAKRNK